MTKPETPTEDSGDLSPRYDFPPILILKVPQESNQKQIETLTKNLKKLLEGTAYRVLLIPEEIGVEVVKGCAT